jgi:hypothetical protein
VVLCNGQVVKSHRHDFLEQQGSLAHDGGALQGVIEINGLGHDVANVATHDWVASKQ